MLSIRQLTALSLGKLLNNNPRRYGPTIHLYNDWSCDIVIPLRCHTGLADELTQDLNDRYRYAEQFVQILEEQRYWADEDYLRLDVVDLNLLRIQHDGDN